LRSFADPDLIEMLGVWICVQSDPSAKLLAAAMFSRVFQTRAEPGASPQEIAVTSTHWRECTAHLN
jgi:hypothetical protein